jgi:anti-sigma regulatory factor (Ser/Thr protein kinase)
LSAQGHKTSACTAPTPPYRRLTNGSRSGGGRTTSVCRVVHQRFPDEPIAAAQARGFVGSALRRWSLDALVPNVQLAVTELVTNAILHARTPIVVTLCVSGGMVEVAVTDYDPRVPHALPHREDLLADLDALSQHPIDDADPRHAGLHYGASGSVAAGRGLIILDAISATWGVTEHAGRKDVWARLPVDEHWPYADDCPCEHGELSTASGNRLSRVEGAWDA